MKAIRENMKDYKRKIKKYCLKIIYTTKRSNPIQIYPRERPLLIFISEEFVCKFSFLFFCSTCLQFCLHRCTYFNIHLVTSLEHQTKTNKTKKFWHLLFRTPQDLECRTFTVSSFSRVVADRYVWFWKVENHWRVFGLKKIRHHVWFKTKPITMA